MSSGNSSPPFFSLKNQSLENKEYVTEASEKDSGNK